MAATGLAGRSHLTVKAEIQRLRRASDQTCDGPDRSDRDGETPIGKLSYALDVQMGTSSANAIRASRLGCLRHRPDIRLQPCLLLQHTKTTLRSGRLPYKSFPSAAMTLRRSMALSSLVCCYLRSMANSVRLRATRLK